MATRFIQLCTFNADATRAFSIFSINIIRKCYKAGTRVESNREWWRWSYMRVGAVDELLLVSCPY